MATEYLVSSRDCVAWFTITGLIYSPQLCEIGGIISIFLDEKAEAPEGLSISQSDASRKW